MKASVKVGSHMVSININKETTCNQFIQLALNECKIGGKKMTNNAEYSLFERAMGIERKIEQNENIFQLCLYWRMNNLFNVEFVIKMCQHSSLIQKRILQNSQNSEKIFKILKAKSPVADSLKHESHIYESIIVAKSNRLSLGVFDQVTKIAQIKENTSTRRQSLAPKIFKTKKLFKIDTSILNRLKGLKRSSIQSPTLSAKPFVDLNSSILI